MSLPALEVTSLGAERISASTSGTRQVASHPSGRRCGEGNCITVLSIYNPGSFCSLHQPEEHVRMRGSR